jgi:hypothetical protein
MKHGERIAALETRVDKIEEVQTDMVTQLEEAAHGLRALAGKIDSAVSAAKKEGCQEAKAEFAEAEKKSFTGSLNKAFEHFRTNFALFLVYAMASGFVWFLWKTVTGDWKIESNVMKIVHKFIIEAAK